MKKTTLLGVIAALAASPLFATSVTVTFTSGSPSLGLTSFVGTESPTGPDITVYGRTYDSTQNGWVNSTQTSLVRTNSLGVGVDTVGPDSPYVTQFTEWLFFDFGATATGNVKIDSITINYSPSAPPSGVHFNYGWTSALPTSGLSPDPTTEFTYSISTGASPYTSIIGSGRYFAIGAVDGGMDFQVASLTYTSVPDGAHTLALMGAALATLGLAARRRKE
jgi:hypothetical protein